MDGETEAGSEFMSSLDFSLLIDSSKFDAVSSLVRSTASGMFSGSTVASGGGGGDSVFSNDTSGINFSGLVRGDGFSDGFRIVLLLLLGPVSLELVNRRGDESLLDGIKSGLTIPVLPSVLFLLYSYSDAWLARILRLHRPPMYLSHCSAVSRRIKRLTISLRE